MGEQPTEGSPDRVTPSDLDAVSQNLENFDPSITDEFSDEEVVKRLKDLGKAHFQHRKTPEQMGQEIEEHLTEHSDDAAPPYEEADAPKLKDAPNANADEYNESNN